MKTTSKVILYSLIALELVRVFLFYPLEYISNTFSLLLPEWLVVLHLYLKGLFLSYSALSFLAMLFAFCIVHYAIRAREDEIMASNSDLETNHSPRNTPKSQHNN